MRNNPRARECQTRTRPARRSGRATLEPSARPSRTRARGNANPRPAVVELLAQVEAIAPAFLKAIKSGATEGDPTSLRIIADRLLPPAVVARVLDEEIAATIDALAAERDEALEEVAELRRELAALKGEPIVRVAKG